MLATSQQSYVHNSSLFTGNGYKLSVQQAGIYKIVALLASLGMTQANISSSSIPLYGKGGFMLPENCSGRKLDDLIENTIWIEDREMDF
jgi:hypothetical protein